jgi:hypothetical protein
VVQTVSPEASPSPEISPDWVLPKVSLCMEDKTMGWFDNDAEYRAIGRRLDKIDAALTALKTQLFSNTAQLVTQGKVIMSKATELQTSLSDLGTTLIRLSTDIKNQLDIANNPTTPDADVDAAIAKIGEINATLLQKATDLEADDTPPPA